MRTLRAEMDERGINWIEGMNRLQDVGLISDNVISPDDVPECDVVRSLPMLDAIANEIRNKQCVTKATSGR